MVAALLFSAWLPSAAHAEAAPGPGVVPGSGPATYEALAGGIGRLVYLDDSDPTIDLWERPVAPDGTVGAPRALATDATAPIAASGATTAYVSERTGEVVVLSSGREVMRSVASAPVRTLSLSARTLAVADRAGTRLYNVDTGRIRQLPGEQAAVWGPYVAYTDSPAGDPYTERTWRGRVDQSAPPILVGTHQPGVGHDPGPPVQVWGDWVVHHGGAQNVVTGQRDAINGADDVLLGDGAVLWEDNYEGGLRAAGLGGVRLVLSSTASPNTPRALVGRTAFWVENRELRYETLAFGGTTPPRLLAGPARDVFTPDGDGTGDTWAFAADFSAPLPSWELVVRSPAGAVVRRFSGEAPYGAIRLVWDGRDAAGALVPAGTYTWAVAGATGSVRVAPVTPTMTVVLPRLSTMVSGTATFPVSLQPLHPVVTSWDVFYTRRVRNADGRWVDGPLTRWLSGHTGRAPMFAGRPGETYRFVARGRDAYGRGGPLSPPAMTTVPYDDRLPQLRWSAGWVRVPRAVAFGGTETATTSPGVRVTFTTEMYALRIVGARCPDCGRMTVVVDGRAVATVDTYAAGYGPRQLLWEGRLGLTTAPHTVTLVHAGGRPRLVLDGIAAVR